MKTNRIEALGDGIFAIVMTLLIIELRVPVLGNADDQLSLSAEILAMWPKFLAYAVTFAVLGVLWVFHHRVLYLVQEYDGALIWLNIVFFMVVSLLPFSTALLGRYHDLPVAILVYGVHLFANWMLLLGQLAYATSQHRLLIQDCADPSIISRLKAICCWTAAAIAAAVLLAFVNPKISLFVFAVLCLGQVAFQVSRKAVVETVD